MTEQQTPPPPQNSDGQAHFTYFDVHTQMSFIWDGKSEYAEICHGGYGEPVTYKLYLQSFDPPPFASAERWVDWFRGVCEVWLVISDEMEEVHD